MGQPEKRQNDQEELTTNQWILWAFIAGFAFILVGVLVLVSSTLLRDGSASGGVIIFVGPFPIVFAGGSDATLIVLISVILTVLSIVLFVILRRKNL